MSCKGEKAVNANGGVLNNSKLIIENLANDYCLNPVSSNAEKVCAEFLIRSLNKY